MTCLWSHSQAVIRLECRCRSPDPQCRVLPTSPHLPLGQSKAKNGMILLEGLLRGRGEGKGTHIQFSPLNIPPAVPSYCHLVSSRTAQNNEYRHNPTLNRDLSLRVALSVGSWDPSLKSLLSHLTLIRILYCGRHCTRNCRRHDLIE